MDPSKLCTHNKELLFMIICILIAWIGLVSSANLPCAARQATAGYICVCNNTYCDTIERPKALKSGKFHHYSTSATQPGFNHETGSFIHGVDVNNQTTHVTFYVNASLKYQSFSGVGAGLSDSAAINFFNLSAAAQANFIESYFGENGLEYVFGRVPVGCSDFSTRTYSLDDVPGDVTLKHFGLAEEDLKLRIPMIKQANAVSKRGLKLIATPWTAPNWMKTSNITSKGFLRKEYERTYVQYLIKYLNAYKTNGVDFWALSQGNEIILGYLMGISMPNLNLFPSQLKTWTRDHFGPMLKKSPFHDLKVITLDDQRDYLNWYSTEVFDDDEAGQYIDGAALHWYGDRARNTYVLDDFHTKYPDKFLIFTESSIGVGGPGNGGISFGKWSNAERYIESIFQNFNHFMIGYVDWNIALDTDGGPHQLMGLDSSVIVNTTSGEFFKEPFFYVLGHFSKFITPGAQRINVTSDQNSTEADFLSDNILDDFVMDVGEATPTGQPGPGPHPTGQPGPGPHPTGQPGPGPGPQPTSAPVTTLLSTAALNPDGSHTFIVYNPLSDSVSITVKDSVKGTFKRKLAAQSLNSFIYW